MLKVKDKKTSLVMITDRIARDFSNRIIAVHIPQIGWKSVEEIEVIGEVEQ